MIGNDIIDFEFAKRHSRWKEQRFLDKLFSTEEQKFILSDSRRFENIWRLWSMKESAYKIISRTDDLVRYNPKDFECSITNAITGKVIFENTSILTCTEMDLKFLQTIAFLNCSWVCKVFSIDYPDTQCQHNKTYQIAIKAFANLKNWSYVGIEIRKNRIGVPEFYTNGVLQPEHLTLTHHGHFGAWAIAF